MILRVPRVTESREYIDMTDLVIESSGDTVSVRLGLVRVEVTAAGWARLIGAAGIAAVQHCESCDGHACTRL